MNGRAWALKLLSVSDSHGLRVSALGTVEGRMLRIIHDFTFLGSWYHSSVNADTDVSTALPCDLTYVFEDVCRRIPYLRQHHGSIARVMLCCSDIKDVFRQIPVDRLHAAKFGYGFGGYAVVDLCLQFEWHSSPGCWDLVASSLEHVHNQTSFQDAVVSEHGRSAVAHVTADADAD